MMQVYLPQVEQPERRAFGWCLHVFTHRGTWGQAEPAVPRWSATCNSLQAPCQTGDACQPLMSMPCASSVFSRQLEACTVSASSACGACGVCLIPLLCFEKGSEQSSTTLVCTTSFDNVCALIHMHLEFRLSLENKHVKTRLFEQ